MAGRLDFVGTMRGIAPSGARRARLNKPTSDQPEAVSAWRALPMAVALRVPGERATHARLLLLALVRIR